MHNWRQCMCRTQCDSMRAPFSSISGLPEEILNMWALMRRVKVKLGPRYDMGQHAPKKEEGWKIRMYGQDWAIWLKH